MSAVDLRGRHVRDGDVVAVATAVGSSGGWLSIRKVVRTDGNDVFMDSGNGRVFKYRAASGFLILPRNYKDAIGI